MIVGGMFGKDTTPGSSESIREHIPPCQQRLNLVAGRCAVRLLATHPEIARVWLPSYVCPAIVDVIPPNKLAFFAVGRDWRGAPQEIRPGDLVIAIGYFGCDHDEAMIEQARTEGAFTLLDLSGCVPSRGHSTSADFLLYSPRKVIGVPDGGILLDLTGSLPLPTRLPPPPIGWSSLARQSFDLRSRFDDAGGHSPERGWFVCHRQWEAQFPMGVWAMPDVTLDLLEQGMALSEIRRRRRKNHQTLSSRVPIIPETAESECPLGFVIMLSDENVREKVRNALISEGVYAPIHWMLGSSVPVHFAENHKMSRTILTIPCDQRYDQATMEQVAEIMSRALTA